MFVTCCNYPEAIEKTREIIWFGVTASEIPTSRKKTRDLGHSAVANIRELLRTGGTAGKDRPLRGRGGQECPPYTFR
jgi:hypothetical protein